MPNFLPKHHRLTFTCAVQVDYYLTDADSKAIAENRIGALNKVVSDYVDRINGILSGTDPEMSAQLMEHSGDGHRLEPVDPDDDEEEES
jgi:hypothetical protein